MVQWTVTAINEAIEKDLKGFAAASEDNYTDQVMAVAMQIRNVREERLYPGVGAVGLRQNHHGAAH